MSDDRLAQREYRPTDHISRDNPFYDDVVDMASDGHSWLDIYEELEEALDAVDELARREL